MTGNANKTQVKINFAQVSDLQEEKKVKSTNTGYL
jgi:hypothetical protein